LARTTETLSFCLPIEKLGYGGKIREARLFIHKQAIILHIYTIQIQVTVVVASAVGGGGGGYKGKAP
jgi:hypothetical protein